MRHLKFCYISILTNLLRNLLQIFYTKHKALSLCHSCAFACQQRVLKTFPGPGYLHSEDGVV